MDWKNLHIIIDHRSSLAYYAPSMTVFPLEDSKAKLILNYQNSVVYNTTSEFSADDLSYIKQLETFIDTKNLPITSVPNEVNTKKISKIMLCVSNDCNLRCKYCYAGGGNYMQKRGLMSLETAKQFVDFCSEQFDSLDKIIFFGGEPFLNIDIIEFICESFSKQRKLKPKIGAVTNGTICNERVLKVINKHFDYLTISIDGPQMIHDTNRVTVNGKGSYKLVSKFISSIKKYTHIDLSYEATFTQSHIDQGYTRFSIANYLEKEMGLNGIVLDETDLDKNTILDYWQNITYYNLKQTKLENLTSDFWSIFNLFVNKQSQERCHIGENVISVAFDGSIYPCHQLNGQNKCLLGNISENNIFNSDDYNSNVSLLSSLANNDKCNNCWCKNICSPCSMVRFFNKNLKLIEHIPQDDFCDSFKLLIETLLPIIVILRKNIDLWNLVKNKNI